MAEKKNAAQKDITGKKTGTCSECGKTDVALYSKGICVTCYKRLWYQEKKKTQPKPTRGPGRPTRTGEKPTACIACGEPQIYARGVCYKCYKRAYQRGLVTKEAIDISYINKRTTDRETKQKHICDYCGIRPVYAHRKNEAGELLGLCRNCYERAKRNNGDPSYKGRSYERNMRNEKELQRRRELEKGKEKKGE